VECALLCSGSFQNQPKLSAEVVHVAFPGGHLDSR
jgi:hypothetical protein